MVKKKQCVVISKHVFKRCVTKEYLIGFILFQAKIKKIKEKYKDQDEEERQLRMEILAVCNIECS